MPQKPCGHPGCFRLVDLGTAYCDAHTIAQKRDRNERSDAAKTKRPWAKWYGRKAWKNRRKRQLDAEPLCCMCPEDARQLATVADHVVPHKGDYALFWFGALQSLCAHCHSSKKQRIERRDGPSGG